MSDESKYQKHKQNFSFSKTDRLEEKTTSCYYCRKIPDIVISFECEHNICLSCIMRNLQRNGDMPETYKCIVCGNRFKITEEIMELIRESALEEQQKQMEQTRDLKKNKNSKIFIIDEKSEDENSEDLGMNSTERIFDIGSPRDNSSETPNFQNAKKINFESRAKIDLAENFEDLYSKPRSISGHLNQDSSLQNIYNQSCNETKHFSSANSVKEEHNHNSELIINNEIKIPFTVEKYEEDDYRNKFKKDNYFLKNENNHLATIFEKSEGSMSDEMSDCDMKRSSMLKKDKTDSDEEFVELPSKLEKRRKIKINKKEEDEKIQHLGNFVERIKKENADYRDIIKKNIFAKNFEFVDKSSSAKSKKKIFNEKRTKTEHSLEEDKILDKKNIFKTVDFDLNKKSKNNLINQEGKSLSNRNSFKKNINKIDNLQNLTSLIKNKKSSRNGKEKDKIDKVENIEIKNNTENSKKKEFRKSLEQKKKLNLNKYSKSQETKNIINEKEFFQKQNIDKNLEEELNCFKESLKSRGNLVENLIEYLQSLEKKLILKMRKKNDFLDEFFENLTKMINVQKNKIKENLKKEESIIIMEFVKKKHDLRAKIEYGNNLIKIFDDENAKLFYTQHKFDIQKNLEVNCNLVEFFNLKVIDVSQFFGQKIKTFHQEFLDFFKNLTNGFFESNLNDSKNLDLASNISLNKPKPLNPKSEATPTKQIRFSCDNTKFEPIKKNTLKKKLTHSFKETTNGNIKRNDSSKKIADNNKTKSQIALMNKNKQPIKFSKLKSNIFK